MQIDHEPYRLLAIVGVRLILAHVISGQIYLVGDSSLILKLPTTSDWINLVRQARAGPLGVNSPPLASVSTGTLADRDAERINFECDLLDRHGIGNGIKAMSIFLHSHWRGELAEHFGAHTPVHTLKRWRTQRARSNPIAEK